MSNDAIELKTYLSMIADSEIKKVDNILKFNSEEVNKYNILLKSLIEKNSSSSSTQDKGDALEDIVSFIIEKSVVFEVYNNVRTSSNEIDQLTRFNKKGAYFQKQGLLNFEPTFLCECKNYNKKISVTWAGKFYSLMKVTKKNLGIIFSYQGLSGSGWNYAVGLTKKLYLSDNIRIIDFNIEDFKKLAEDKSFIDLINEKIFSLENDTNTESFISSHPNESIIQGLE